MVSGVLKCIILLLLEALCVQCRFRIRELQSWPAVVLLCWAFCLGSLGSVVGWLSLVWFPGCFPGLVLAVSTNLCALFTCVYLCLPVSTCVYLCLPLSTSVYHCLPLSTLVYLGLPLFTFCFWRSSSKCCHGKHVKRATAGHARTVA